MLLNERCCEKEQADSAAACEHSAKGSTGRSSPVLQISNWEIYKTAGENAWSPGRRVHVKELQKAPFFVFKSQGPLQACHASATAAPLLLHPLF